MTVPLWRRAAHPSTLRCDTLILGGGITGVAAALALERAGVDALIIERGEIASGASGRNAGYLMRGAADNYAAAVREWGRDAAKNLWKWTENNLAMLRAEGIESIPTYRRVPSCLLALAADEEQEIRKSERLLREDGFEVSIVDSGKDSVWRSGRARVGLINPNDATCNPHDLLRFLAGKLNRPPATHREITHLKVTGSGARAWTADTLIESRRVLVCLNAFSPLMFPAVHDLIAPKRGQMLAFRTGSPIFDYSYYSNHGSEYYRQATPDTAILGGWRKHFAAAEVGYEERTTPEVQQGLESFAASLLGAPIDVTARWAGTMGFTPDGLPLIGPIDERGAPAARDSPIWLCAGYTGHGMSMAFKAANEAVAAMLARTPPPFPISRFCPDSQANPR